VLISSGCSVLRVLIAIRYSLAATSKQKNAFGLLFACDSGKLQENLVKWLKTAVSGNGIRRTEMRFE
jgi:hypothetical protein